LDIQPFTPFLFWYINHSKSKNYLILCYLPCRQHDAFYPSHLHKGRKKVEVKVDVEVEVKNQVQRIVWLGECFWFFCYWFLVIGFWLLVAETRNSERSGDHAGGVAGTLNEVEYETQGIMYDAVR